MTSTHLTSSPLPSLNAEQQALYERVQSFDLDVSEAELSFSDRLAQENDWSLVYVHEAIEEYKKFVFLAVTAQHSVIPSDAIDRVWHLHLTYTRSYWDSFCLEILQQPLHHDPALGGLAEKQQLKESYGKTLESYQQVFGMHPPARLWPTAEERFRQDLTFVRVSPEQNLIVPYTLLGKGIVATALFLLTLLLSGFYLMSSQGTLNPTATTLLIGFCLVISFGFVQFMQGSAKAIKNRNGPSFPGCSAGIN
ncbi:MAG: glycine-rich domain-containing protein [Leptolyngbyaceae cyanobacterium]